METTKSELGIGMGIAIREREERGIVSEFVPNGTFEFSTHSLQIRHFGYYLCSLTPTTQYNNTNSQGGEGNGMGILVLYFLI